MTEAIIALVSTAIGAVIGFLISKNIAKAKSESEKQALTSKIENFDAQQLALKEQWNLQLAQVQKQLDMVQEEAYELRHEKEALAVQLSKKESDFQHLQERSLEQKQELEKLQEKFTKEFENLANKILEEKSSKFTEQNKENIKNILGPLQEKIQLFEKKVDYSNEENLKRHYSMTEQLRNLKELNQQITKEASNLTRALKGDTKMQGNWGELVLERVLEKSGLEKGSEYTVQNSFTTEEGKRVLPDVIIHLPDNKKMIVDSKVSLIAYERYVNEEDENLRPALLKEHLNSVRKHVEQLSAKSYHELYKIESPDFVLLFIPLEPAFAAASQLDSNLYSWAFEKNIVIVTPSTLLATLRTIDSMWQNEKQHKNAMDIAIQAGRLYDQFKGLLDDFEKVGKQLQTVQNSYTGAMTKLTGRGNLLGRVEKLKKLGAKASKQIDQKWINRSGDEETLDL
ncbi:DNA recombination protein RmuC [Pustulibacterium marinum]|uniref:DNA recombination protein RmuC n=1 Tax=Pustulibacterium marinum TaxID=1224947 RepID=A0A1I7G4J7_9FLAO|nr:DNA recombination protein RmuC [Pustulibacterium marinum]SFU43390.1 DNA recombination protein RmuC [Pustulibacterium marinum]